MSSVPVPVVSPPEPPLPLPAACANCGAVLTGAYCASCGQRHEPLVHNVTHFASEAFESITHADSRLWRTLGYLLARPGRLTRDFFDGKRAAYLPPFRLYLVISLLFFVVGGPAQLIDVSVDADGPPTAESVAGLNEAAQALESEFGANPGVNRAAAALREAAAKQKAALESGGQAAVDDQPQVREIDNKVNFPFCQAINGTDPGASVGDAMTRAFCKKASTMSGRELLSSFVHNLPRAMFVFLPLLALIMKPLYWRPKRYYVEHLLLLVHNHAFVFLALTIVALLASIPVIGPRLTLLRVAVWVYMIWYIFRAMRVYYGQSRWLTFGKYAILGVAYFSTSVLVLVLTAFYTALTL